MTDNEAKTVKASCLKELHSRLGLFEGHLKKIDSRLWDYAVDVVDGTEDVHNIDEILALRKFLRCLATYDFDYDKVHRVFRAYEQLKFSGLKGRQSYALTPVQCFMLAGVFGPQKDGKRLVRDATYFIPRKFCKTTMGAFFQFWWFLFEDANSEGYCVANSQDQAKILYKLAYDLIHQLDPDEKRIRFTATEMNWKVGQGREAKVAALSAGGKAKDGMFAQLVTADEYGSAGWVKDHCDMSQLLQVIRGSMGPRREPLVLTTTTAGRVHEGPFELRLRQMQKDLLREMDYPVGEQREDDADWMFLLALHPDQWEISDEILQEPRLWRKCNPHVGITVQPDYYENEWKAMRLDEETKREQICKLFNVFQSDRTKVWLNSEEIRKLQTGLRIDDLNSMPYDEDDNPNGGWRVFIGQDFSKGDDLCGQSYLAVRNTNDGVEFFADLDAWISEHSLYNSSNSLFYKKLVGAGWLHVSPGKTIDEALVVNRNIEIAENLEIVQWGYDAYDAKRFVNAIGTWLQAEYGILPDDIMRPVSQTYASYNSPVQEMTYMVQNDPPLIHFSGNPLWPYEFNNCMLDEDRYENVKPVKSGSTNKVDNVQALLSALKCYDDYLTAFNNERLD